MIPHFLPFPQSMSITVNPRLRILHANPWPIPYPRPETPPYPSCPLSPSHPTKAPPGSPLHPPRYAPSTPQRAHASRKTKPIPQPAKSIQPFIPQSITSIFHPEPPRETNPIPPAGLHASRSTLNAPRCTLSRPNPRRDTLHASRFTPAPRGRYACPKLAMRCAKQSQFPNPQKNANYYFKKTYPDIPLRSAPKNKPNSNRGKAEIPMHIGTQSPTKYAVKATRYASRNTLHEIRFTRYASRLTPHASRLTPAPRGRYSTNPKSPKPPLLRIPGDPTEQHPLAAGSCPGQSPLRLSPINS